MRSLVKVGHIPLESQVPIAGQLANLSQHMSPPGEQQHSPTSGLSQGRRKSSDSSLHSWAEFWGMEPLCCVDPLQIPGSGLEWGGQARFMQQGAPPPPPATASWQQQPAAVALDCPAWLLDVLGNVGWGRESRCHIALPPEIAGSSLGRGWARSTQQGKFLPVPLILVRSKAGQSNIMLQLLAAAVRKLGWRGWGREELPCHADSAQQWLPSPATADRCQLVGDRAGQLWQALIHPPPTSARPTEQRMSLWFAPTLTYSF